MPQVGEYEYDTDNSNVLGFGNQGVVYRGHHQVRTVNQIIVL